MLLHLRQFGMSVENQRLCHHHHHIFNVQWSNYKSVDPITKAWWKCRKINYFKFFFYFIDMHSHSAPIWPIRWSCGYMGHAWTPSEQWRRLRFSSNATFPAWLRKTKLHQLSTCGKTATWPRHRAPPLMSSAALQRTASQCLRPRASWTESLKWSAAQWSPVHTYLLWWETRVTLLLSLLFP